MKFLDFTVEIETGRDAVILQLTDPQIIDSSQQRVKGRISPDQTSYWAKDRIEERCFRYLRETIRAARPDLILLTGDLVYGEFDDSGESFTSFVEFMESFGIPWAPVFGNHDQESKKGADWQCEQLEKAEHCLFRQRTLTGNGNYTVGILQNGRLKRVFFMLDSNGCVAISQESRNNAHSTGNLGFGADQIKWYTDTAREIKSFSPQTKISFAFHVQLAVFEDAYRKYGFTGGIPLNIDRLPDKSEGDFGYITNSGLKGPWDGDYTVWNSLKELGVDSIFVGHEHCSSASVVYKGVRLQYGQKSSTYDRFNSTQTDGRIIGAYPPSPGVPLIGGTVFLLAETDGSIKDPYIYLCRTMR